MNMSNRLAWIAIVIAVLVTCYALVVINRAFEFMALWSQGGP